MISLFCLMLLVAEGLECNQIRPPRIDDMPIYATAYNWQLGGHNCNSDCGFVAISIPTEDWMLDRVAACPSAWLGTVHTTVVTLADGSRWWCVDAFGAPVNREPVWLEHHYWGDLWVARIDFAVSDPWVFPYNQQLLYGWSREWRFVSELYGG